MKYIKKYESVDIDPFGEEDWDEVDNKPFTIGDLVFDRRTGIGMAQCVVDINGIRLSIIKYDDIFFPTGVSDEYMNAVREVFDYGDYKYEIMCLGGEEYDTDDADIRQIFYDVLRVTEEELLPVIDKIKRETDV